MSKIFENIATAGGYFCLPCFRFGHLHASMFCVDFDFLLIYHHIFCTYIHASPVRRPARLRSTHRVIVHMFSRVAWGRRRLRIRPNSRTVRMDGADLRRFDGSRRLRAAADRCRRRQGGRERCACRWLQSLLASMLSGLLGWCRLN